MKYVISFSIFLFLSLSTLGQFSEEFERVDSLNRFKDVMLDGSLRDAKAKMGLVYVKGSDGSKYSISNKKYLKIDNFSFIKGYVWLFDKKLKFITIESSYSDSEFLKRLLDYFSQMFGEPNEKEGNFYWTGYNMVYNLVRNTVSGNIMVVITNIDEE